MWPARVIYLLRSRMKNKDAPPSFDSRDEKPNLLNFYLAGMRKYMIIPWMLMIVASMIQGMMIPQYTRDTPPVAAAFARWTRVSPPPRGRAEAAPRRPRRPACRKHVKR